MRALALAAAACALALAAPRADAAVIFRDGFESLNLAPNGFTIGCCGFSSAVPRWFTDTWRAGIFNPTGTGRFDYANGALLPPADGTSYAYLQLGPSGGARIARGGDGAVVAGATYTLTVAIGAEAVRVAGGVNNSGWYAELYTNNSRVARMDARSPGAAAPAAGGWVLNTLSWTATAADAGAGQPLVVVLGLADPGSGGYRVANFDNVTLSVALPPPPPAPVPAPGALGLLGLPLLGLVGALRLRAATKPA
jgi:hypothetical protein